MDSGIIKKILIGSGIVLAAAFILVALTKKTRIAPHEKNATNAVKPVNNDLHKFWAVYREATAHRMQQEWEDAIEDYQHALRLNPEHKDALYYLGNMFLETGREPEAEKTWLNLILLNPESARAHFQLGNLYLHARNPALHNLDKAKKEFTKTFSINKDFLQPLIKLGEIALYQGDLQEAWNQFHTVLGTDKQNAEANLLSGFVLWKQGQEEKARPYFTKACQSQNQPERPKGTTKEGDTQSGKSLERQLQRTVQDLIYNDLPAPDSPELKKNMNLFYQKLDKLFTK